MNTTQLIPVTVLTGFLGSGKTTLLNRLLTEQHGRRIAVIENEFGEIGIDNALVVGANEEVFEMNNGCICCTVRGDLIRILGNLVRRRDRFDYVLVETTGLADPGPVAQTFFVDEDVRASYRLDGIITLVDARHVHQHLDSSSECQKQIAFADKILLNKTDLASDSELVALERKIRSMNSAAHVLRTRDAAVPASEVVDLRAFDLNAKLDLDPRFLEPESPFEWSGEFELQAGVYHLQFRPGPDPTIDVVLLPLADDSEPARTAAQESAVALFDTPPREIEPRGSLQTDARRLRLRLSDTGVTDFTLRLPHPERIVLFTQHLPGEFEMSLLHDGHPIEPARPREHAGHHTHDNTVGSVGIAEPGPLVAVRLNEWMASLLRDKGADIFRMKGVLDVQGSPNRVVFQGVHMLFDARADRPWKPNEPRTNQLVFIGRNLDRASLLAGFRGCLA